MTQVLTNVLDNAVAYSPGGAAVEVSVQADGEGVALAVRDGGIGIHPDEVEAIFAPFARSAGTRARELPGLGLGLSIAYGIVAQHDGWIRAESGGEGRGTTVTFWLPSAGPPGAMDEAE